MNVWYITMVFPVPSETFVPTEVDALRRRGVQVSVHSLASRRWATSTILAERGLENEPVSYGSIANLLTGLLLCFRRPRQLWTLLRLVFSHCWPNLRHLLISLALIPRTMQLFVQAEKSPPDVVQLFWGHYPSLLGQLFLDYLPEVVLSSSLGAYDLAMRYGPSGPVARRADMIRAYAAASVESIVALGVPRERIEVVYHSLDVTDVVERVSHTKVPRRIVSAGRLIPDKGMDDVLTAFRKVHDRWSDATLVILGDGPERERLEKQAADLGVADAVQLAGHVPYERVFDEMAAAEILLFLSHHEVIPNVVKEAMAAGCLCVTTDTCGIDELLRDGKNGFVVPVRDPEQATQRIFAALEDDALRQRMVDNAREHVHATFDREVVIPRLLECWNARIQAKMTPHRPNSDPKPPVAATSNSKR